jgi:hypothetical protein
MSQPGFRVPGPIGLEHGVVQAAEPDHHQPGGGNGTVIPGGFSLGLVSVPGPSGLVRHHQGKPAFPHIHREQLYLSAKERMEDPSKINQSYSSLCGPAALLFLVAKHHPLLYYQFVIDLYEFGKAKLNGLEITPSKGCRKFDPLGKIDPADWVALAGIRDSENTILQYSDTSDEAAGITLPSTLAGWLAKAGFKNIYNETNLYLTKGESNLREAAKRKHDGAEVCLFIDMKGISGAPSSRGAFRQIFTSANHWVVLNSDIAFDQKDGSVQFQVFTWGHGNYAVPQTGGRLNQKLTLNQWLQNYYGYVACKP